MMDRTGRLRAAGFGLALSLLAGAAAAAPTAVELVFEQPFLAKVGAGTTLSYRFVRITDDKGLAPSFQDDIRLNVAGEGDAKTFVAKLYSGVRERTVGPLPSGGNPMVIVMLEQDVAEMQKVLGGSPYYIRNRMRDAINAGESVEPVKVAYDGKSIDGWKLTLRPFAKDANRDKLKDFADRVYEITFADGVPGGLYRISAITPRKTGGKALLTEDLTLTSTGPTEAKP